MTSTTLTVAMAGLDQSAAIFEANIPAHTPTCGHTASVVASWPQLSYISHLVDNLAAVERIFGGS